MTLRRYSTGGKRAPKTKTVYVVSQEDLNNSDSNMILGVFTTEAKAKQFVIDDYKDVCGENDITDKLIWEGTSASGGKGLDIYYDIQPINMYPGD